MEASRHRKAFDVKIAVASGWYFVWCVIFWVLFSSLDLLFIDTFIIEWWYIPYIVQIENVVIHVWQSWESETVPMMRNLNAKCVLTKDCWKKKKSRTPEHLLNTNTQYNRYPTMSGKDLGILSISTLVWPMDLGIWYFRRKFVWTSHNWDLAVFAKKSKTCPGWYLA